VRSPGNADWAPSVGAAFTRAEQEKKFVFVELDNPECGNCRRMDALLYPAFEFEAILIPMVPAKVELDSPDGQSLARRYDLSDVPSILVTTSEGRLVFRMQGFLSAPDFYAHIEKDLAAYRAFAKKIDAQDVANLPATEAVETGRDLLRRRDPGAALPRLERAAAASDAAPPVRDEALELAAAAQLDLGRIADSRRTIEKLIRTTKDPDRRERAELFQAQIPLSENKPEEALQLFQQFRQAHPQSSYSAKVDEMIQRLEGKKAP